MACIIYVNVYARHFFSQRQFTKWQFACHGHLVLSNGFKKIVIKLKKKHTNYIIFLLEEEEFLWPQNLLLVF